ncbi:hypothetical protein ACFQ3L_05375 [Lacticaseibacillus jixianensis]|uniref:Uncharacterized protein n=1 Tax=Lacticaseibacillus jixianensis TaxID=2486012 RepID=A0ABW4BBZ3_9LACO|nr:hypothetical protein [Lacticaseibacillus jixianensis]
MLTPSVKVFMYMLTMSDEPNISAAPVWRDRYHLAVPRVIARLLRRGLIAPAGQLGHYELTSKGQAALTDIDDWLWIHEYYLADVIDFDHVWSLPWRHRKIDYAFIEKRLAEAKAQYAEDATYQMLLLRHQLRLEYDTHHNLDAIKTLMALIDADLDPQPEGGELTYQTTWAKMSEFEKSTLKTLLGRLNWTMTDFEMQFSNWLEQQPRRPRLFTRFELMTIVMYEIGNAKPQLCALYQNAAARAKRPAVKPDQAREA